MGAKEKAEGKAKVGARRVQHRPIGRDLAIGPPFRLKYKTWRQNFRLELYGRVSNKYILHITSLNFKTSPNFRAIMQTILEEVKAGALTTKGQVSDRRDELVEIERAEGLLLKRPFVVGHHRVERLQQPIIGQRGSFSARMSRAGVH